MRFNKSELLTLASQPAHKYEKEGVLTLKEKSEGFFRRSESSRKSVDKVKVKRDSLSCVAPSSPALNERWFRLCGNLLFYLRTRDHWSEPLGVIVLENCTVTLDPPSHKNQTPFQFTIGYPSGGVFTLCAGCEAERASWVEAISAASFTSIRARLEFLKSELQRLNALAHSNSTPHRNSRSATANQHPHQESPVKTSGYVKDVSESPLCEISVSCDNLRCDAHGRPPSAKVLVHVRNSATAPWTKYAQTEVAQRSSNPVFLTTISLRSSDGVGVDTEVRLSVVDVRERMTTVQTTIGHLTLQLGAIKSIDRIRLPISGGESVGEGVGAGGCGRHPGFLSLLSWNLEREENGASTESTPSRLQPHDLLTPLTWCHRRTQSLPPRLGSRCRQPSHVNLDLLFGNVFVATYRFHSGLGGDIFTHELMAEPKLTTTFPLQLLSLWICEEKELVQEMVGLGELREPWHSRQVEILQRHLSLINNYSTARHTLTQNPPADFNFKQSARKGDPTFEFLPLNLHLQRIWAHNESLHKSGFHDVFTVGAFTAYAQGYDGAQAQVGANRREQTGLGLGQGLRGKVEMTYEWVQGIKRLRKEIVERMQIIMRLAKERRTTNMHKFVEEIYHRCRLLLTICDQSLIEEAFEFFERQKLSLPANHLMMMEDGGSMSDTSSTSRSGGGGGGGGGQYDMSKVTSQVGSQVDEGIETPNSPLRSLVDLFKKRATMTTTETSSLEEDRTPDSGVGIDDIVKSFLDSPSSNYYRPCEEPEPWELTQVNIEASVISLNSKVKVLCGQGADIQHHSLRPNTLITRQNSVNIHSNISRASGEGIHWRKSLREDSSGGLNLKMSLPMSQLQLETSTNYRINNNVDVEPNVNVNVGEGQRQGQQLGPDWSEELRSSVKKLRLAMDGLLKTSRLAHSIFRLQEKTETAQLAHNVKYRRDVCFSQALTSVVVGLMSRLWCGKTDGCWLGVLSRLGPLVSFHSLLTNFSHEAGMLQDVYQAVHQLRTVHFTLVPHQQHGERPEPKVFGSRWSMRVVLPVPDSVWALLPICSGSDGGGGGGGGDGGRSFMVTPVLFNMGINEKATLAERLPNAMEFQHNLNLNSFATLNEYYRKFNKLTLPKLHQLHNHNHGHGHGHKSKRGGMGIGIGEPNVDILLDKMHNELLSKKKKNIEIFNLSAQIARALLALRFTSCKSGKDRTSMSSTLEQVEILSQEYDLAEHEFQAALDAMRSEGCRRENTLKNIGQRKYAFNNFQVMALPTRYRPPPGTFGNVQS